MSALLARHHRAAAAAAAASAPRVHLPLRRPWRVPRALLCSSKAMDEQNYHRLASVTLEALQDVFEEEADDQPQLQMDVEYSDGVLNVIIGSRGTFVMNKQAPNQQIWLSSPVSGPLRYDFEPSSVSWINSRDRHPLLTRLVDDYMELVGRELDFGPVETGLAEEAAR